MIRFIKYSNDRDPRFSIRTEICEENGKLLIRKVPDTDCAKAHVAAFPQYMERLNALFADTCFCMNRCEMDGDAATFEYLTGGTMEERADALLDRPEALRDFLAEVCAEMAKASDTVFSMSADFQRVFGDASALAGTPAYSVADIDMILSNMIEVDGWQLIDYEWTFLFPVPLSYIRWRMLLFFFSASPARAAVFSNGWEQAFGISEADAELFRGMEDNFQAYVKGNHTDLTTLWQDITPGGYALPELLGGADTDGHAMPVRLYPDFGEGFSEATAIAAETDRDGRFSYDIDLSNMHALRIDPTEHAVILQDLSLVAEGLPVRKEQISHGAILQEDGSLLFADDDPQLLVRELGGVAQTLHISFVLKAVPAAARQLVHDVAYGTQTKRADLPTISEKNRELRDIIYARARAAAETASQTLAKVYRKAEMKKSGRDPFAVFRPLLDEYHAARLYATIDRVAYKGEQVIISGWSYDSTEHMPAIPELRDRSLLVPVERRTLPREDVNEQLGLPAAMETGFTIRFPLSAVSHDKVALDFVTVHGYLSKEISLMTDAAARRRYNEEHAEPVYADDVMGYDAWLSDRLVSEETLAQQRMERFPVMPLLSICIPLYRTAENYLRELLDSLLLQSYEKIEICLADGSPDTKLEEYLSSAYLPDARIKYRRLSENRGIAGNTNAALAMAEGDFIVLCDHDDVLEKDACFEIARAINESDDVDIVYTDEDKLMTDGSDIFYSPNFKPDYNPDLLRSNNYITHIFAVRRSISEAVCGEREAYDGAQDYDFILRCAEKARRIVHVPKILYHWRAAEGSTAGDPKSKYYAYENGRKALQAHFDRVGISATAKMAADLGSYHSLYRIQGEPLVSIIIPNKDMKDVLARCVNSVFEKSTYRNYEIIIAENNSETTEIFDYYKELTAAHENVRVITWEKEFNYAAINNFAAREAQGDYLLFLNNDTEVITERWIEELLGYCQREDVGACGARLYYPDDRLQHCGVVVGIGGIAGHICHLEKRSSGGYFGRVAKTQDVSAVTAACMMVKKERFFAVDGFEEALAVAYNDVDLCLKLREQGWLIVYDARAELYHYESLSRGSDEAAVDEEKHARQMEEAKLLRARHPEIFEKGDPYFNPNLDYHAAQFVLAGTVPAHYGTLTDRI